jgi:hypothetical protein
LFVNSDHPFASVHLQQAEARAIASHAAAAHRSFALYDQRRLETYQEREGHDIRISSVGEAMALRFDDVAYFNRIYAPDESIADRLAEAEAFYRGSPFGCFLVGPPAPSPGIEVVCQQRGWAPGPRYSWLHAPVARLEEQMVSPEFVVSPPRLSERELFLRCYLEAFEAQPNRFNAAISNMRHLFDWPDLLFLLAWKEGQPAGIAMLLHSQHTAVFCAGATLPSYRNGGCHAALLAARVRLVRELGCQDVFSWAFEGSQSEINMGRIGLQTMGVSALWHFLPNR